jgi:hypothetical protein
VSQTTNRFAQKGCSDPHTTGLSGKHLDTTTRSGVALPSAAAASRSVSWSEPKRRVPRDRTAPLPGTPSSPPPHVRFESNQNLTIKV